MLKLFLRSIVRFFIVITVSAIGSSCALHIISPLGAVITSPVASRVVISGPAQLTAPLCTQFSLLGQDSKGNSAPFLNAVSVNLSTPGKGSFYSDSNCSRSMTGNTLSVPPGVSISNFYFLDPAPEWVQISAVTGALPQTTLNLPGFFWVSSDDAAYSGHFRYSTLVSDAAGNVYGGGSQTDLGGVYHWIVRKKAAQSDTWVEVDNFQLAAGQNAGLNQGFVDAAGNPYFLGWASAAGAQHWIIRKGTVNGTVWNTVDNYSPAGASPSPLVSFSDSAGNLYVTGYEYGAGTCKMLIRSSPPGGAIWSAADSITYATCPSMSGGTEAYGFVDGSQNVYYGGSMADATNHYHWLLRRSAAGSGSWSTVQDITASNTGSGYYFQSTVVFKADGTIFFTLYNYTDQIWLVEKGTAAGTTWANVDPFLYSGANGGQAQSLLQDLSGNLYVAGEGFDGVSQHWVVRKSDASGAAWTTIDDYQLEAAKLAEASSMYLDSNQL